MIATSQAVNGNARYYTDSQTNENLRVQRQAFGLVRSLFVKIGS